MGQAVRTIAALVLAAAILICGNGLQNTLLAVRANIEGFPLWQIGLLTSAYFVGFIAGCRQTPGIVRRVGHIRAFTALASLASASALAHAIAVEAPIWVGLRIITGFALAGLQMIIESWINEKTTNEARGKVLASYRIVDLGATMAGQALLTLADPAGFVLFAIISILISISLVPVALTTSVAPRPITEAKLDIRKLVAVSPVAAFGSLAVGAANGAFWSVGPVYVQSVGYDVSVVATFVSAVVLGGAVAQWPLGFISDAVDRRIVIIAVAGLCAGAGVFLSSFGGTGFAMLMVGAIAFGLFAMPLFGLCIAHANDRAEPDEYLETNGGLFLLYGVGSVGGPLAGAALMMQFGAPTLFLYTSVIYAALAVFGAFRTVARRGVPTDEREPFVAVPRTSPTVFEIDPRGEEHAHAEPELHASA